MQIATYLSLLSCLIRNFLKSRGGQFDAHRPLDSGYDLERILTRCETRTVSKDLSFSFNSTAYQILENTMINRLKNRKIEIRQKHNGRFKIFYDNKELKYVPVMEYVSEQRVLDHKEKLAWKPANTSYPGLNHPWKKYGYQIPLSNHLKRMRGRD